jgi:DNA-directed RNA polymerase subunit M/transcription elongation factor TFIIS
MKRKEYEEKLAEIEFERKTREPELMDKLDEVIERVRNSRHEKLADNEEVWQTVTGSEIERPKFICGSCGNENHTFFITDPHTGDTICLGKNNMGCGNVVQDHYVDEGQQYRKFADDTVLILLAPSFPSLTFSPRRTATTTDQTMIPSCQIGDCYCPPSFLA